MIECFFHQGKAFLDYGGGYGILVRLMRDLGYPFYWYDKYCKNLLNPRFVEVHELNRQFDCVTAIELFEHFVDPVEEVSRIFSCTDCIIFTTELIPKSVQFVCQWEYFSLLTGQHISFYTKDALEILAARFQKYYVGTDSLHLFSSKKIQLSEFYHCLNKAGSIAQSVKRPSLRMSDYYQAIEKTKEKKIMLQGNNFQWEGGSYNSKNGKIT